MAALRQPGTSFSWRHSGLPLARHPRRLPPSPNAAHSQPPPQELPPTLGLLQCSGQGLPIADSPGLAPASGYWHLTESESGGCFSLLEPDTQVLASTSWAHVGCCTSREGASSFLASPGWVTPESSSQSSLSPPRGIQRAPMASGGEDSQDPWTCGQGLDPEAEAVRVSTALAPLLPRPLLRPVGPIKGANRPCPTGPSLQMFRDPPRRHPVCLPRNKRCRC
ncbi:uncharacterized protein [Symphalangus syndactylus]|uniref:uncharacterized protein isoform X2 n=1 Tax=Symphalangus syndactylus TaxID=9590 RepID=UPI0024420317|nr:uncharacterized protein LOC129462429 [Symphalangus syndactylus]